MQVHVTGGNKWKEALLKRLGLFTMGKGPHVKVGILDGATYSGEEGTKVGQSVATVAFWNEYGTKTTPPRPFFRNTIEAKRKEWIHDVGQSIKVGLTVEGALENTGKNMAMDIVATIKAGDFTPLARSTVRIKEKLELKEPQAPLQASLTMIKAISHEVEK